jgi:alkylation response protein AidB-like acyl-CoA dehydrogenase
MNFSINDEQTMLADSISRFIDSDYDFRTRQKIVASDDGYSRDMWETFAALGWTAVPFAETDGGLGGGPIEMMLIMEQFGRGLVVEPYLANIVLAGGVLKRLATSAQREQWLAPLIAGELQAALAFAEPQGRFNTNNVQVTAKESGEAYVLSGKKTFVLNGGNADILIIPARTSGSSTEEAGISLFCIATDTPGVSRQRYPTVDGSQAADISLVDVKVFAANLLGNANDGHSTLQAVVDEATLAVCAEAMGVMQSLQDKTVEYTKNRVQFGVPISSFQSLQHRMVDTLMICEQSRSLLYWTVILNNSSDAKAASAISALKYQMGTAGIKLAEEAVQLHGGMGMTWEMDIGHYFKRMTAINILFGNADHHLDRYISYDQS